MAAYFEFSDVDAFTAGTIGRPGQRTFLLQARISQERAVVKCEKQQVQAIAQYFKQAMTDLPEPSDRPIPAQLELVGETTPVFSAGPMALGYDRDLDRFVLTVEEFVPMPDDDEDAAADDIDKGHLRVYITRAQAVAFAERADQLMAASRPNCQFCGLAMDPDGHHCPRMN